MGHGRLSSKGSGTGSEVSLRWEIHPSRVVIDRLPDGTLHKLGSGALRMHCSI